MRNDFSNQFRPILERAYAVAQEYDSPVISSEHFVLSALRKDQGHIYDILRQLRAPLPKMRSELEQHIRENASNEESTTLFEQQYKITIKAIRHLQLALTEARKMNLNVVGDIHILLALMNDPKSLDNPFLREFKNKYLNFNIFAYE